MIEDIAEFSLFKIITTHKVVATNNSWYINPPSSDTTYIDVIFDYTNLKSSDVQLNEAIQMTVYGEDNVKNKDISYSTENNYSPYSFKPLTTNRLHCYLEIPSTEANYELEFLVGKKIYRCKYHTNDVVRTENYVLVGDVIKEEDFAEVIFNGIEYTSDLMPSNVLKAKNHLIVDDPSNTYLVAKFDITNLQNYARQAEEFLSAFAIYQGKYNYNGFLVVETDDGSYFSYYEDIEPLSTWKAYILIEVPIAVTESEAELTFMVNGKEYIYKE